MPRGPRLDAPGTLHHVMVRGIERRAIFRDDRDRADFLRRLAALAAGGALTVYAWARLPTHGHLLVRTGTRPLARAMRSRLTGDAARADGHRCRADPSARGSSDNADRLRGRHRQSHALCQGLRVPRMD